MSVYKYNPLHGNAPIRLLHIQPGNGSERICCQMIHTSLLISPKYEALSYTWGADIDPEAIECDGCNFLVRRNLHAALMAFRQKDSVRVLWIDALCINQENNEEKTQQIMLMGEIYKHAHGGLIWLGETMEDDKLAFEVLKSFNGFIRWYQNEKGSNQSLHPQGRSLPVHVPMVNAKLQDTGITRAKWRCLNRFFQRPWFTRVWIIQEAAFLASSETPTLIVCGNQELLWDEVAFTAEGIVRYGMHFLFGQGDQIQLGHTVVRLIQSLRCSRRMSTSKDLLALLQLTHESRASDLRDKVFALHGLLSAEEASEPILRPDYNSSVRDVYKNVALYLLQKSGTLRFLQLLPWTLPQNGGVGGTLGLPSWVPDWSRRHAIPQLPSGKFHAGGYASPEFRIYEPEGILLIMGKLVDRLAFLMPQDIIVRSKENGENDDLQSEFASTMQFKTKWYQSCLNGCWSLVNSDPVEKFLPPPIHDKYPTGKSLRESFWRTLICNMDMQRRKPGLEYEHHWLSVHRLYLQYGNILQDIRPGPDVLNMMAFEEPMALFAEGRRFCTTENGYMGWVPQTARPGDLLCILKGGEVPFLLRRALFWDGKLPKLIRPGATYYQIIGECYIHGFMEGELTKKIQNEWMDVMLC